MALGKKEEYEKYKDGRKRKKSDGGEGKKNMRN
jgi:hypothetical protein